MIMTAVMLLPSSAMAQREEPTIAKGLEMQKKAQDRAKEEARRDSLSHTAGAIDEDSPYFRLMGEADEAIAQNRWDDAATALKAALKAEPGHPTNILLMSNLGMVYFHSGRDSLALEMLNHAHSMAPTSVTVLQNRARVLAVNGQVERAYADYTEILRLDSMSVEPRMIHGMMALGMEDYATAEEDFMRLEQIAPNDINTLISMASLYRYTMRFKEALPYLNRLIARDPASNYYGERALCRLMTDDLQGASDDIAEGLKLNPQDGELYLYRSLLNKARFREEDAKADGRKAVELGVDPRRIPR